MHRRSLLFSLAAVAAVPVVAAAQAPRPAATPPTFSAATNLVEVDAEVDDAAGQFVDGLTAADFHVTEDGRPQRIQQFYLVRNGRRVTVSATGSSAPAGAPTAASGPRLFVVIFDNDHITPAGYKKAREAAVDLFSKHFQAGDLGGVVTDGQLAGNHLTGSREELLKAIDGVRPSPKASQVAFELRQWPDMNEAEAVEVARQGFQDNTVLSAVVQRVCTEEPDQCARDDPRMQVFQKAEQVSMLLRDGSDRLLSVISALMNGLERFGGRKTILLLSEGFVVDQSWPQVRDAIGLAARANARIYSLDVRGLRAAEFRDYAPQEDSLSRLLGSYDIGSDAINSLAVDTGGYVVRNTNLFGQAVSEIADEAGTYYVLGYRTDVPPDGKFRKIAVSVDRHGLKVRARRGYVATAVAATTTTAAAPQSPPITWNTNLPGVTVRFLTIAGGVRLQFAGPPPFGGTSIDMTQADDGAWVGTSSLVRNCPVESSWHLQKAGHVLLLQETCAQETPDRGHGITVVLTLAVTNLPPG